jgi:asparagine synthetase B (glutamine-hydrolysing)
MIWDEVGILGRIRAHGLRATQQSFEEKLALLEIAMARSLGAACLRCKTEQGNVHLTLSGGVDSSVGLAKMRPCIAPLVAHTMAARPEHPDVLAAQLLVEKLPDVSHHVHLLEPSSEDRLNFGVLVGRAAERPDNYYMLMKVLAGEGVKRVISFDCIDELLCGYHAHKEGGEAAFHGFLARLAPDHLEPLSLCSTAFGVTVELPYASAEVCMAASWFELDELVDEKHRKKPMYALARKLDLPQRILERRKYGLVQAFC